MIPPSDEDAGGSSDSDVSPSGPGRRLRVLVVDDHLLARCAIRWQLQEMPDLKVVGEAVDGFEAVALAKTLAPDLVFMDICMRSLPACASSCSPPSTASPIARPPGMRALPLTSSKGRPSRTSPQPFNKSPVKRDT